jgi:Fe-S oxidoreductase
MSRPGDYKPIPGIEDMSVPVEKLGVFLREMHRILKDHNTSSEFYGHASAGCLHVRPILNIKSPAGKEQLRSIGRSSVDLAASIGGSISAEHGDGLARGEWLEILFGNDILNAFIELKNAADPRNLLNPGKIVSVSPMDQHMRYSRINYVNTWDPKLDFSQRGNLSGAKGLIAAVEQCNGAGVCRKHHGFMCPSFQVTREEMHSTRGRANLMREMIYGSFPSEDLATDSVHEALDLCLACKGCKDECPSAVDMAKLKYEFIDHFYASRDNRRKVRDYFFGYIDKFARIFYPLSTPLNLLLSNGVIKSFGESILGITMHRELPKLSSKPFTDKYISLSRNRNKKGVILLLDAFNRYFFPDVGRAAYKLIHTLGYNVFILPINGGGRTLLSKGFLTSAQKHAKTLVKGIHNLDPSSNYPIVGIEPSEIYTLKDEFQYLLPHDDNVIGIGKRAFMIDEFLIRPGADGVPRLRKLVNMIDCSTNQRLEVFVHGHCYQKAQPPAEDGFPIGVEATVRMLEEVGYKVNLIDDGCCGMAGSFGYEAEHYPLSMDIGELTLFPAVRRAVKDYGEKVVITAAGISCQAQIEDGTGIKAVHPICLII